MIERIIAKGTIYDLEEHKEYLLGGFNWRGDKIFSGNGYYLEIKEFTNREDKYHTLYQVKQDNEYVTIEKVKELERYIWR